MSELQRIAEGIEQTANTYIIYLLVTECLRTVCDLWVTYVWPVTATVIDFRFPFTWQLCSSGPAQLMRISKSLVLPLENPSRKFCVPLQTLSHFPSWRLTWIVPFPPPEAVGGTTDSLRRRFQNCAPGRHRIFKKKIYIYFQFMCFIHSNVY